MDDDSILLIVLFVLCIIGSAYFSSSESAFARMNKIRAQNQSESGDRKAKNALFISNNYDKAITTILIGNNIVNIAAASIATLFVSKIVANPDSDNTTMLTTLVVTVILFIFGEMIPKAFANDRPDTTAFFSGGFLRLLMNILKPFVWLFSKISNGVSKLFKADEAPSITEEDLYEIIEKAEQQGVVDEEQSDLMLSVLDFSDVCVADVMTPRDRIEYLDIGMSRKEMLEQVKNIPHSRIPLVRGNLDNVVGILHSRTFLRLYIANPDFDLRKAVLKPRFVKADENGQDLLDNMRSRRQSLGIVRDAHNKTCGLVSIEDFLEELVGEIWDEEDSTDVQFQRIGRNKFFVRSDALLGHTYTEIGAELPDLECELLTVAEFADKQFSVNFANQSSFTYGNVRFSVASTVEGKIKYFNLQLLSNNDITNAPEGEEKEAEE